MMSESLMTTLRYLTHRLACAHYRLSVPALLYLAAAFAPQAAAQCGPTLNVPANQWTMVGVPCVPAGPNNTVATFFGPSLNGGSGAPNYDYNSTWVLYRKGYSPADCTGAPDPNNCYVRMAATNTVAAGNAFWLYTTQARTINFSGLGAGVTPGPNFNFPAIAAESNANPRYYMFSNPYEATVSYANFRWSGLLFGFIPLNVATPDPVAANIVTGVAHYWNGNAYFPRSYNGIPPATFAPKEGAWLEYLLGVAPLFPFGITVSVPDPTP